MSKLSTKITNIYRRFTYREYLALAVLAIFLTYTSVWGYQKNIYYRNKAITVQSNQENKAEAESLPEKSADSTSKEDLTTEATKRTPETTETEAPATVNATSSTTSTTIPAATTPVARSASTPTPTPAPSAPVPSFNAEDYVEGVLHSLINAERARVGVGPLTSVALLNSAAGIRVGEEAITSFVGVDHTRPNGSTFDTAYPQAGYSGYTAWGENLVFGYKSTISTDKATLDGLANQMFTSWKNSPGHYENMVRSTFNQTGIGVKLINQGGHTYYFAIQDFARK